MNKKHDQKIEETNERKYFFMVPNIIDELGLNVFEYRLLSHYYRRRQCWESVALTSKICKMGKASVFRARNSLEQKGLIEVERKTRHFIIKPIDLWLENINYFSIPKGYYKDWKYLDIMRAKQLGLTSDFCTYCGGRAISLEHWISKKNEGKDERENYVISCIACNSEKGSLNGDEYLEYLLEEGKIVDNRNDPNPVLANNPINFVPQGNEYYKIIPEGNGKIKIVPHGNENRSPQELKNIKLKNKQKLKENKLKETLEEALRTWATLFPTKPKPRPTTKSIKSKWESRMKDQHFKDNWKEALRAASQSPTLQKDSWFNFRFFVYNDENYQKCLDEWMSWKDEKLAKENNGSQSLTAELESQGYERL